MNEIVRAPRSGAALECGEHDRDSWRTVCGLEQEISTRDQLFPAKHDATAVVSEV